MATRICRRCNEEQDFETGFFNSPMSKGGKNTICKQCVYNARLGNPRYYKVFTCSGCGIDPRRVPLGELCPASDPDDPIWHDFSGDPVTERAA